MKGIRRLFASAMAFSLVLGGAIAWAEAKPYDKNFEYVLGLGYKYIEQFELPADSGAENAVLVAEEFNDKFGLFDLSGQPLTEMKYDWISPLGDGVPYMQAEADGRRLLLDREGQEHLLPALPENYQIIYSEEVFAVADFDPQTGGYGESFSVYSYDGTKRVTLPYADYRSADGDLGQIFFHDGLYCYRNPEGSCGAIGPDGRIVIEPQYEELSAFVDGRAWAKKDGKYGLIDKSGAVLLPFEYDAVQRYGDAVDARETVAIVAKGKETGVVDRDLRYTACRGIAPSDIRAVDIAAKRIVVLNADQSRTALTDYSGNEILPMEYDWISPCGGGCYRVSKNGGAGVVRADGSVLLDTVYFDVTSVSEGLCGYMKQDGKMGYVDEEGREVFALPEGYRPDRSFSEGFAVIQNPMSFQSAFIDKTGTIVMAQEDWHSAGSFQNGVAIVNTGIDAHIRGMSGVIRYTGDVPSSWAMAETAEAEERGLIPEKLRGRYKQEITRAEFAQTAVQAAAVLLGKTPEALIAENANPNAFTDTDQDAVECAVRLGIVEGMGDGTFEPERGITRQEAAKMLISAYRLAGSVPDAPEPEYLDYASVADWAKLPVAQATALRIMNGMGDHLFEPLGSYTREQSYVTFLRMAEAVQGK